MRNLVVTALLVLFAQGVAYAGEPEREKALESSVQGCEKWVSIKPDEDTFAFSDGVSCRRLNTLVDAATGKSKGVFQCGRKSFDGKAC